MPPLSSCERCQCPVVGWNWTMAWKGFGRKLWWPNRGTIPASARGNERKPRKSSVKIARCPGRYSKRTPELTSSVSAILLLRWWSILFPWSAFIQNHNCAAWNECAGADCNNNNFAGRRYLSTVISLISAVDTSMKCAYLICILYTFSIRYYDSKVGTWRWPPVFYNFVLPNHGWDARSVIPRIEKRWSTWEQKDENFFDVKKR